MHKIKGSEVSVRKDLSQSTRNARKKFMIVFAKAQKKPFKLSVDKLRMDDVTYMHWKASDMVMSCTR